MSIHGKKHELCLNLMDYGQNACRPTDHSIECSCKSSIKNKYILICRFHLLDVALYLKLLDKYNFNS